MSPLNLVERGMLHDVLDIRMLFSSTSYSPNIIFDDADLAEAVKWSAFGLFFK